MLIPDKKTFVEQTADYLREQILSGEWKSVLPAERELAGQLQVARNTVRNAIQMLSDEGLLFMPEGRRRHCIVPQEQKDLPASPSVLSNVVFLTNKPLTSQSAHTLLRADLIRRALANSGIHFRVISSQAFKMKRPSASLRELTEAHPQTLWILHHATEPIQRWFQSEGILCAVFGSTFPGISLPGFSVDLAASMHHAMGLLKAKGHTSLVLMEPPQLLAGHMEVHRVMSEQAESWDSVQSLIWDGNHALFPKTVKRLMEAPHPPTAFILMEAHHATVLYSTFCHLGLRIPDDASVIALLDDPQLGNIIPPLSHYRESAEVETKRASTLIRQGLRGSFPRRSTAFIQDFVAGGSVAPPPAAFRRNKIKPPQHNDI